MTIQYPSHSIEGIEEGAGAASQATLKGRAVSPYKNHNSTTPLPIISYNERSGRGRYWAVTPAGEAELTYIVEDAGRSGGRMVINGAFVPIAARGAGIAQALIARAASDAQSAGREVAADCPFVASVLGINPLPR